MRAFSRLDRRAGVVALALSALLSSGCYTNHVRTDPSAALSEPVKLALVGLSDGSLVRVRQAQVRGDTLVGTNALDESRVAVPVERVRTVEVRELDSGRTGLAILVGVVAAAGVLMIAALAAVPGWT